MKEDESVAWVNALVGRVAWDFLGEKYWVDWVSKKIQMKLSKIRVSHTHPLKTLFTHIH